MLLRSKMVLILSSVVVLYAAADHIAQRFMIAPSFSDLERVEAKKDRQRTVEAIKSEIRRLDMQCVDWAAWDDTYRYIVEPNQAYIESTLGRTGEFDDRFDLLILCRPGGE